MTKQKNKIVKIKGAKRMNQEQFSVFLYYWGMGGERSLEKLWQKWEEIGVKNKRPHLNTIENWSGWFNWQAKIKEMDEEANQKLFDEAVGAARQTRVEIMKVFRAVVLRFAEQIRKDPARIISSFDIATFWKMARIEMGLPADNSKIDMTSGGEKIEAIKVEIYGTTTKSDKDISKKLASPAK
jgi:hypothetical protein